ncbi:hypothetical protein [Halorubrum sp. Atlit-28R]|uniref:hypothetical protein n=1 Tax=Halorubrum sp. Atlit-28R TaxID=2282129 RepID=UPI0011C4A150|nr:hypothetical protein [Halorubrum sp. Atlit-28R]
MEKNDENSRENSRHQVVGQKRDMLLESVYDTTKFADLDKKIRERGYEETESIVQRGIRPEDPFDFYQLIRHYTNEDNQAIATWIGLDPEKVDSGEVSYDMIEELDEIQDLERDTQELYPVIVAFLNDEGIAFRATSTGIEEDELDNSILRNSLKESFQTSRKEE